MNLFKESAVSSEVITAWFELYFSEPVKFVEALQPMVLTHVAGSRCSVILIGRDKFERVLLANNSLDAVKMLPIASGDRFAIECLDFNSEATLLISSILPENTVEEYLKTAFLKTHPDMVEIKKKFPNQKGIIERFESHVENGQIS